MARNELELFVKLLKLKKNNVPVCCEVECYYEKANVDPHGLP